MDAATLARMQKASEGAPVSRGGMNMDEMRALLTANGFDGEGGRAVLNKKLAELYQKLKGGAGPTGPATRVPAPTAFRPTDAERKAREEADRRTRQAAERKAREEAERKARGAVQGRKPIPQGNAGHGCHHIDEIENYFTLDKVLGAGSFGKVYMAGPLEPALAILPDLPAQVAVKEIIADKRVMEQLVAEIGALVATQAIPSTMSYYGCLVRAGLVNGRAHIYMVMELLNGVDLAEYALSKLPFGPERMEVSKSVLRQLAETIREIHSLGIVHHDIKPANIMVIEDPTMPAGVRIKLVDFGLACLSEKGLLKLPCSPRSGTPSYLDPEAQMSLNSMYAADWWTFGQVLLYLYFGYTLAMYEYGAQRATNKFQLLNFLKGAVGLYNLTKLDKGMLTRVGVPAAWHDMVIALCRKGPQSARPSADMIMATIALD